MTSPACRMSPKNSDATLPDLQRFSNNKRLATGPVPLLTNQSFGSKYPCLLPQGKKQMLPKKPKNSDNATALWDNVMPLNEEENSNQIIPSLFPDVEGIDPVTPTSMDIESLWGNGLFEEPHADDSTDHHVAYQTDRHVYNMTCVNPRYVEGLDCVEASIAADIPTAVSVVAGDIAKPTTEVALEDGDYVIEIIDHNVPKSDMIRYVESDSAEMMSHFQSDITDDVATTSVPSHVVEMDIDENSSGDDFKSMIPRDLLFDLYEFVTDDNVQIDDQSFQAMIDDVDTPLTIDASVVQVPHDFAEPNLPVDTEPAGERLFEDAADDEPVSKYFDDNPVLKVKIDPDEPVVVSVGEPAKRGRGRPRVAKPFPVEASPPK